MFAPANPLVGDTLPQQSRSGRITTKDLVKENIWTVKENQYVTGYVVNLFVVAMYPLSYLTFNTISNVC